MRVLAVDDDATCLMYLETLLRRCQYSVTTTNQAVTALQLLREKKDQFDLVISDIHIPDMDGFKLLELVGLEMDLPVIMLSGNGDPKNVMKGITHGACDYLLKPVRLEQLKNIWQHVVRKKKVETKERNNTDSQDRPHHGSGEAAGCEGVFGTMSRPSETFTPADPSLSYLFFDDNPNQTQEISHVGEQNVDKEMVGLDISKSSRNKQKTLRSDVWKFMFEKCKDEYGNDLAKCNLCEKLFNGSSKKGTTHLRNHFKSCQKKRNEGGASGSGDKPAGNSVSDQQLNHLDRNHFKSCQNKRNEGEASGSGDKLVGNSVTDQQLNHLDWVRTCIKQCNWDLPKQVGDADIISVYNEEKEKLRIYFENLNCRFSLRISNVANGKYAGFTVHFIDEDWKLEEKMIGLKCIEGDQNMKVLKNVLLDWGIDNKISSMVTEYGDDSDIYVLSSDESENRFSGQGSLLSNCKSCVRDFYDIDMTCPDFEVVMKEVIYDHMSKICNYIRETSSKNGTFQIAKDRARSLGKEVTAEDIPTEEEEEEEMMTGLDLGKIALGLKEAFFELENMDLHFKSINLTKEQWDVLTTFYQFCDEEADFDWDVLDSETANMYFPVLCRMYKKSLVAVTLNPFISGERYLRFVKDAKKCWDQRNLILAVAAVLDPRVKMDVVEQWYKKIYGDEYETQLEIFRDYFNSVYNEYAKGTDNFQSSISYDISGNSSHDQDSGQSFNFELHLYLKGFPLIKDFDILKWWRLHSRYFPTLAKMARDFLSIKITTRDYMSEFLSLLYQRL
ncbi:hypothetical protein EZV62_008843 [Acer yangbiense]|uniref:BED-type domain-containing protein n=1 Tax=Acer yangbiense TaxID=1000413 RepID=A0A5C7IEV8_9ROSI|nr:hypothetical protein EZV62_008843 [Acer yangbiense]